MMNHNDADDEAPCRSWFVAHTLCSVLVAQLTGILTLPDRVISSGGSYEYRFFPPIYTCVKMSIFSTFEINERDIKEKSQWQTIQILHGSGFQVFVLAPYF